MYTYSFITKSYVQHEVTVKAKSEDEAWEKFYDREEVTEEEVSSDTYYEELDWTDEEEKEEQEVTPIYGSFINDKEKMRDFYILSKQEFLQSYSYLTELEYDLTAREVA